MNRTAPRRLPGLHWQTPPGTPRRFGRVRYHIDVEGYGRSPVPLDSAELAGQVAAYLNRQGDNATVIAYFHP